MRGFAQFSTHLCMAAIPLGLLDRDEKIDTLKTLSASYKKGMAPGTGSSEMVSCPSHPLLYEWSTPSKSRTRVFFCAIRMDSLYPPCQDWSRMSIPSLPPALPFAAAPA